MPAALAPLPALSTEVCANDACRHAQSPREMCTCTACEDGAGHGIAYRAEAHIARLAVRTRMATSSDVFLGAAADDDEPVAVNYRGRTLLLDPEDMF